MFLRRPEHQGKRQSHDKGKAGEDEPTCLPIAHEIRRLAHLRPFAKMVYDDSCRQGADSCPYAIGHEHEQALG